MAAESAPLPGPNTLPPGAYILSLCQGLGISAAVISVSVSGLVGLELSNSHLATLPYGLQFAAIIATALPVSMLMERIGRRPVFLAAAGVGMAAGALGAIAVATRSFALLCLAHLLLGCFLANVNLFRFAALDLAPPRRQPAAMSLVLFGGVFAAILGPALVRNAGIILPGSATAAAYASISVVTALVGILLMGVRLPRPAPSAIAPPAIAPPVIALRDALGRFLANRRFIFAMAAGGLGYGVMNLLMISSSLQMQGRNLPFAAISYAIQIHVFCMFSPSLFAARIINALGARRFVMTGAALFMASGLASLLPGVTGFAASLILLGLGWNALYTGGSWIASDSLPGDLKFRGQGFNDLVVSLCSTAGAMGAGAALTLAGWRGLNIAAFTLATGLLCWGAWRGGRPPRHAPTLASTKSRPPHPKTHHLAKNRRIG